ncbi:hypothetical protein ACJIZ3_018832 [Penstemon smallii]|uniref:F-box domain-containing protein n=1 Tax=Penstemon smallii TaxID=265156 RepID=A0ABD3SZI9_9LAMI
MVIKKAKKKYSSPDWTSLPTDLVHLILEKLILLEDYIRFSAVCKRWFSVGQDQKLHRLKTNIFNQPPMLVIPQGRTSPVTRSLYNVMERKTYVGSRFEYDNFFVGSSFGWLATVSENLAIDLINPFSGKTIELPPISKVVPDPNPNVFLHNAHDLIMQSYSLNPEIWRRSRVVKVILSDNPCLNPDNYIVAAIVYGFYTMAFIRPGKDDSWTYLNQEILFLDDILFYKGKLYAVDYKDRLIKINDLDKDSSAPNVEILIPKCDYEFIKGSCLAESVDGELLHVKRIHWDKLCEGRIYTKQFQVFKLGKVKDGGKEERVGWVEIESLGSQALFLGMNHSVSILVNDDLSPYIQQNSIYYMDCNLDRGEYRFDDVGIYNLKDQSVGPYHNPLYDGIDKHFLPSIWISPTLQ